MKKNTQDLVNEIATTKNISQYMDSNQEEFIDIPLHVQLKKLLADTGVSVSRNVEKSCRGDYVYQVFRGIKTPGRDVLLCIALAMELPPEETNHLLRIAHMSLLDIRNRRDSIILFALNRALTVPDTNDILYEYHLPCL